VVHRSRIDISREKNSRRQPNLPGPSTIRGSNQGNKILPEHIQYLQQLYKVDPDLSVDEVRNLLFTQFDDLNITTKDLQNYLDTVPENTPIKSERHVYADPKQRHEQAEEDKLRAELASKLTGTGKITVDHLMFLHKLYKEYPTTPVSQATKLLCEEFKGLQITPSGVRYHLKNKLNLPL
jgi:hypothetical protein